MGRTAFVSGLVPLASWSLVACAAPAAPEGVQSLHVVRDDAQLRAALQDLAPGALVVIGPGVYSGRHELRGVKGTAAAPIVICGDPRDPPVFEGGGSEAWHLSGCEHLVLRDLIVRGFPGNGINVDDGGARDAPSRGIRITRVTIEATGPDGNHDALKLSGVDEFLVEDCTFRGWGGSAVDLVGCHDGEIRGCVFEGLPGFSQHSGVQLKGGTARVAVRDSRFLAAGARAVNAGGHTGGDFFRPPDARTEAQDLTIEACAFAGGEAPIAAVGVDGLQIRGNWIHLPEKWVLRLLLENREPRLAPTARVIFTGNTIVFDARVRDFINVGPGVGPDALLLRDNRWIELGPDGEPVPAPRRPVEEPAAAYDRYNPRRPCAHSSLS